MSALYVLRVQESTNYENDYAFVAVGSLSEMKELARTIAWADYGRRISPMKWTDYMDARGRKAYAVELPSDESEDSL